MALGALDIICELGSLGDPVIQLSHHQIATKDTFSSTDTNKLFLNGVNIPTHLVFAVRCFLLNTQRIGGDSC